MKKIVAIVLIVVAFVIYLNRSYAYIYNKIDQEGLGSSDFKHSYQIGDKNKNNISYVAIGDSLTSGVGVDSYEQSYPFQIAQKLSDSGNGVILKTAAFPGAKSVDFLNNFIDSTVASKPDVITILIGINDIHGLVSVDVFEKNYKEILNRLTQETKAKIYIVNIPYLGAKNLILPPYNFYFDMKTQKFNKIIKQVANDYDVNYVDLYSQTLDQDDSNYASDLFHPTVSGYNLWSNIIYDAFNK